MVSSGPSACTPESSRAPETPLDRRANVANPANHCPKCGRWFERKDAVKRHLKTHERVRKQPVSGRRSCLSCVSCKVRCSNDRPSCDRCARRGIECVYDKPGSKAASPAPARTDDATMLTVGLQDDTAHTTYLADDSTHQHSLYPIYPATQIQGGSAPEMFEWDPFFPTFVDPQILGAPSASTNTFSDILSSYLGSLPLGSLEADTSCLVDTLPRAQAAEYSIAFPQTSGPSRTHIEPSGFQSSSAQKENDHGESERLPILEMESDHGPGSLHSRQFSLLQVDNQVYDNLQSCLRAPSARIPWHPISLDYFPPRATLDSLIDLYFANFDQFLPMIHRPTFDPGENPALTLSMCAIGSCYSNFKNRHHFAKSMCELLRRFLLFMGEFNASVTRSQSHLAAQLLQSVLGKASGSKRLYELGDNNRGILVSNARGIGLFDYQSPETYDKTADLQSRWEAWICAERSRRIAWCIYIFDASATYYRNCRPNLSLFEIRTTLPCRVEDWEAGSAQAWAASHPWTPVAPDQSSLQDAIHRLFPDQSEGNISTGNNSNGSTIPSDEFHRMLVATTLIRMVWDQRESLLEPTRPLPSLQPSVLPQRGSKALLAGLAKLTTCALATAASTVNKPSRTGLGLTERQFRGLILRARVSLIAQIIAADNVTDHLALICSRQPNQTAAAQAAETRLLNWARADPSQPRKLVHVGAKLLAISRLYIYHYPREPFDAFQGGLLVYTMLRLLRSVSNEGVATTSLGFPTLPRTSDADPVRYVASSPVVSIGSAGSYGTPASGRACKLDWLGNDDAPEAAAIHEWIENDGPFVLGIHGVADLRSPLGEKQVLLETARILSSLRVWGISKTYSEIVVQILDSEHGW